jgi:pimeloyl-ACP methyl ester carboxylesterase
MSPQRISPEPIPHWPGRLVDLGDHKVFVRSAPGAASASAPGTGPEDPHNAERALCVHGLEGSSRNWTDLMALLPMASDAVDLPGFAGSPPRPDGRYSITAHASTVIALIEAGHGPVHLIANSLGGAVAVRVAAARPDLVRSLTLVSPALPDLRPRLDLLRFPVVSLPRVGVRLLRQYQLLPPERRVADVITNCFSDPSLFSPDRFATEVTELSRRDELGYAAAVLVGSVRTLTAEALRPGRRSAWKDASRITAPTLVIYGSHDRLVDPRAAGRAAHVFADARIVVLPRTGHVAHMEHPAQVAAEIGFLLDGAPGAPGASHGAPDSASDGAPDSASHGASNGAPDSNGQAPSRAAEHGNSPSHQPVDANPDRNMLNPSVRT